MHNDTPFSQNVNIMSTDEIDVLHAAPMDVGESPLWHPSEAALYWIDIPQRAIHRHHLQSGHHQSWLLPSEPGCIARNANGGLVVAMRSGIAMFNTENGQLTPIVDAPYDTARMRFNDGRCDSAGRLWVGTMYEPRDQPLGSLFCLDSSSGLIDKDSAVTVSNGVAFSLDDKTLYHADTTAHRIVAYDFEPISGKLSNRRLFKQFSTDKLNNYGGRPDGATVDSENAYWIAMFEGGRILRLSPTGEVLREIKLPVRCPTMMAFGGSDLRTLYITSAKQNRPAEELSAYPLSGCVLSIRVDVPGRVEPAYMS